MDPDSTAGTSVIFSNNYNSDEDYISKLLDFDDNCSGELPPSSVPVKTMANDTLKINHDQMTPEETPVSKITNGHSHPSSESFDENEEDLHHNNIENGFNLAQKLKELMHLKKEAHDLKEKFEQTEKAKNELQLQVNFLQAENHQFKHLKNEKEENSQKLDELQKDLTNKSKAQLKLRNEIESCNLQISEKNDAIKKMKRDNKSLWNMVTRFARKLASADLLTTKEKNIMKKYGKENHIPVDSFDGEDQGEEKKHSSLQAKNEECSEENNNKDTAENKNTTTECDDLLSIHVNQCDGENSKAQNDGFQFNQNNTSVPKPKLASGANYFMKSCRDVIEDPHVSDDCLDVTVNDLKEMRRQLSASKDHFSPISPLPPTPPPTSNKFKQGLAKKCLAVDTSVLTLPVNKNPNETPMASKNQGLLSVDSSVPNSARKLTFCHQQSEGFETSSENNSQRLRSDAGNVRYNEENAVSHTSPLSAPYKFSAKRCHDGTVKLNFHINNPISLTVNPNNWEVSCILGQQDDEIVGTPQSETANVQPQLFNNNLVNSVNNRPVMRKISKIDSVSPELATTVLKSSEQSSFVSVGKTNVLNHDKSVIENSCDYFSKEKSFHKEMPLHHPHTSINDNKTLDAFSNLHGNNVNHQQFENTVDDNRSVVSSSCESPSPYRKKNELFSREFLSPPRNLTAVTSQVKTIKVESHSNVSKINSPLEPKVNSHLKYDSSGSETELAKKPKLTKMNSVKSASLKKRRKSNLMSSVESSNFIPARNKGRTHLSRAFGCSKNSINTEGRLEVEKLESSTGGEKSSTTVQLNNEKILSEINSKIGKEIQINTSSNNSSKCMKLAEEIIGKKDDAGESMQQIDTVYENMKSKKRISRVEMKKNEINDNNKLVQDNHKKSNCRKKKAKRERKAELRRMAAIQNKAEEWAAQKMISDVEENVLLAKEPFSSNSSLINTLTNSLEKHNTEQSVFPKAEKQLENNSVISEVKLEEKKNFTNDLVDIPVEVKKEDISVEISSDTFFNALSSDYLLHKNIKGKTNTPGPNSRDSCALNDQFKMFHTTEVDIKPVLTLSQSSISADNFRNNRITLPKIENDTSLDNIDKNLKGNEIENTNLCEESSVETNYSVKKKLHVFPKPISNDSLKSANPISSPTHKSPETSVKVCFPESSPVKIRSPKESPTKIKSADSNCFSSLNSSVMNISFPEVILPPLPLDPFGLSDDKTGAFSNRKTCVGEKSSESSKNKRNLEMVNNVKSNFNTLFEHEEIGNESFIDFLIKDEIEDLPIKTTSDKENASNTLSTNDNSLTKAIVTEMKESSATFASSGNVVTKGLPSVVSSLESVSNNHSMVDMTVNSAIADNIIKVKDSEASPQAVGSGKIPTKSTSKSSESKAYSNVDTIINSVAVGGIEIEVETQDPPPRTLRKRQSSIVDSPPQTDKKRNKGGLKSINLSIAKESALSNGDTSNINDQISDADSDNESPLVIAEDIEDVQQSIPIPEESESPVKKNTPTKTIDNKQKLKTPKKADNNIDLSNIETAFQVIDRMRFTETNFKLHVHNLMRVLINPSIVENTPTLVYYLIKYLHTSRRNPMLSFSLSSDPDILLPASEKCIVQALLAVAAKNKSHLGGLLPYTIETLFDFILGKNQYQIHGLSSMCRVFAAMCKELNEPTKTRQLCMELIKYNKKYTLFLIASIVGVYRNAFEVLPDSTDEEKIFLSAFSYGVQEKPKTLTEVQWKHCSNVFSKYLTVEFLADVSETLPYLMSLIEDKCLTVPYEGEFMLMGPLVIYARANGWNWAREHLLEDYVIPNLEAYSQEDDGERAFSFFTHLCAEICVSAPDVETSRSFLMEFWKRTGEREFVQILAGAALLKLILLRNDSFPDEMQHWIPYYHEDPRVIQACGVYFTRKLLEDHELALRDNAVC